MENLYLSEIEIYEVVGFSDNAIIVYSYQEGIYHFDLVLKSGQIYGSRETYHDPEIASIEAKQAIKLILANKVDVFD